MVGLQKYLTQHLRRIGVYVSMDSSAHELFCGLERIFQIWQSPRPQRKVLRTLYCAVARHYSGTNIRIEKIAF